MSLNLTINSTGLNGYVDPVAQSFLIEKPVFLTKIGVYFSTKDDTLPVNLSIRTNEGGFPSSNVIVNTTTVVDAANVLTSNNAATPTFFNFKSPIYLESGEYSFVLSADTNKYRVWISEFGQTDITTGSVITKQPYAGTMYRSQNGYTWEDNQLQDIKFDMYRAKFTSSTATVDLILDNTFNGVFSYLVPASYNGLKSYAANTLVKITAPRHGLVNGSTVQIVGLQGQFSQEILPNNAIIFNGIPFNSLDGVNFTASSVSSDSFFITLSTNAAVTANITTGSFGGNFSIVGMPPYSSFYSKVGRIVPPGTDVTTKLLTTSATPALENFIDIAHDSTVEFTSPRKILSPLHISQYLSSSDSFVYRMELSSTNDYVSPLIDLPFASATFITNDVNTPSISDNYAIDNVIISNANVLVSISNTAVITFGGAAQRANVKSISPGAYVNIAGFQFNSNGTYRVASVDVTGNSIVVCPAGNTIPSANAEAAGRSITITYNPNFIDEQAIFNTSSKAKYFTRTIELENPSSALVLRMAACTPANSAIEVYYKLRGYGENSSFLSKEFDRLDLGTMKATLPNQFVDYEKVLDDLPSFTGVIVKIVLKSSDISVVPKVKDLRIIALE